MCECSTFTWLACSRLPVDLTPFGVPPLHAMCHFEMQNDRNLNPTFTCSSYDMAEVNTRSLQDVDIIESNVRIRGPVGSKYQTEWRSRRRARER